MLALLISVAASQSEMTRALWLMLLALLVDSTDGILARRLRVSEVLPFLDVVRLDDLRKGRPSMVLVNTGKMGKACALGSQ